jgi:hypothetical protein
LPFSSIGFCGQLHGFEQAVEKAFDINRSEGEHL